MDSYHVTLDIVYVFIGTSSKYIHFLHTFNGDQRWIVFFEARGSVHRNSMWIKIQQMQQYADIYLL